MRLDVVPETLVEGAIRLLNLGPVPLVHTHVALLLARAVMEASRAGVFAALGDGPATAADVAARCGLDTRATAKLLDALAASGYFRRRASGERYSLTAMSRKWMLPSSPVSMHDKIVFTSIEDGLIDRMGEYLRTGAEVSGAGHLGARTTEFWTAYQRAMRAVASVSADEVARRTRVPAGARDMLDIGGAHGLYSVRLCRRHPQLASTILELPEAIPQAAPLLAAERMGDRVRHRAGNVLRDDLGEATYDLVLISSVLHHFDEPTNRALMCRIARALRPGGAVVVQEFTRGAPPGDGGQLGALLDLYFSLTSAGGTWTTPEIAAWQRAAGLRPRRAVRLRTMIGVAQQAAVKP